MCGRAFLGPTWGRPTEEAPRAEEVGVARDIQERVRKTLASDSARAVIATAVGEAIKGVGASDKNSDQRESRPRLFGVGGLMAAAGAGAAVPIAARRIRGLTAARKAGRLVAEAPGKAAQGARRAVEQPRSAIDAFTSKLADREAERPRTTRKPSQSRSGKRSQSSRAKSSRSAAGNRSRSAVAKPGRASGATSGKSSAKSSRRENAGNGRRSASNRPRSKPSSGARKSRASRSSSAASSRSPRARTR